MPEKTSICADLAHVPSRRSRRFTVATSLGMLIGSSTLLTSCVTDPDCGVCDPDRLVLEIMSADNYSNDQIFLLSPECEGDKCPKPKKKGKYFVNQVLPCLEAEAAENDDRPPEEYCKISPLVTLGGLEFVFNNLLDPTSIELVRKQPDDPSLLEVYDWKSRIARIEGPISRFNGDYLRGGGENPDVMARSVNLSCIDNLAGSGALEPTYAEALAADPFLCQTVDWGGDNRPIKMRQTEEDGSMPLTKPRSGQTTWKGFECSTPDEGPDTCCTVCDYELSVNVAKYGVSSPWDEPLEPDPGSIFELQAEFNESKVRAADAIPCVSDGTGNKFDECRGFTPGVFRADQESTFSTYTYEWNGEVSQHKLPRYDKLRETHPDDRPAGIEQMDIFCDLDADCPSGAECIGEDSSGAACEGDTDCTNKRCRQSWFVECVADPNTTGDQGFCVDSRFKDAGAGACYVVNDDVTVTTSEGEFTARGGRDKLSLCDTNENNFLNASECCLPELGYTGEVGENATCDPLFSQNVTPVDRFERDQTLPTESRDCFCGELSEQRDPDLCASQIETYCTAPYGSGPVPEGAYITQFVSRFGGVIYDPALKGVSILPSDLGNYRRARVEACAETVQPQPQIAQRSILDGWRAGDSGRTVENNEDFDRAMCSGSEYRVVFETSENEQRIEDKPGNTLAGKDTYVFQTPEFRVVPNSGFPTDNIRIGGCDRFELSFSNKFDLAPDNLNKIQIWEVERTAGPDACPGVTEFTSDPRCWTNKRRIAGGPGCTPDDKAGVDAGDEIPCLTVDVAAQFAGTVNVQIDSVLFGRQLFPAGENDSTGRYRMIVPGLNQYNDQMEITTEYSSLDDLATLGNEDDRNAIYRNAFHDACGMPLVTAGMEADTEPDFLYDFSIDSPKCIEDQDLDGVQLSCDNAPDHTNRGQTDDDADGFGNIIDRCVLTPTATNTDDTDRDGLGSACDNCRRATSFYNVDDGMAVQMVQSLLVRNNPVQTDADQDGIGDACDNCPTVPNCESFGNGPGLTPHTINTPIQDDNTNVCQTDNNMDMVGDSCEGAMPGANAAGPIGTGVTDDFDQDGIENAADRCPRFPVTFQACTMDSDCPTDSACEPNGVCNHVDSDNDGVGNICDNCPAEANMGQVVFGQQADDDPDGDFVGSVCETNSSCFDVIDPRPYSFYDVSADGQCCTLTYPGDGYYMPDPESDTGFICMSPPSIDAPPGTPDQPNGIMCDPDGLPITQAANCDNEPMPGQDPIPDGTLCRKLPTRVEERPGVLTLPPGCEEALADAGITAAENVQLSLDDAADEGDLWSKMCFLPQFDQDFDGIGDACDLCRFSYDPGNEPFISETTGQVFPTAGRYCNGVYDIENSPKCTQMDEDPGMSGTGTGTGGGTGTSG